MSENFKIEKLAEEFGISKFYFIKRFKSSTNVTPHHDITYMLNFSDQSHFSNSFKKIYGMTPREFRKTIQ